MEQNKNHTVGEPVRVIDFLKLFVKKLKLLVIIGIIFAILGGAFGGFLGKLNTRYIAEINIRVSPTDQSDALLLHLQSGLFAEKLLLEENGLPAEELCNAADYKAAVDALAKYEEARKQRQDKYYELSYYYMAPIENKYQALCDEYNSVWSKLKLYKETPLEGLERDERENHLQMIETYEEEVKKADEAKRAYYEDYYAPARDKKVLLQTELAQTKDKLTLAKKAFREAAEKVLAPWRNDAKNKSKILRIADCVSYEYFQLASDASVAAGDKNELDEDQLKKGYIKVSISVPQDEKFANELVDRFRLRLADNVESFLESYTGAVEVSCEFIDPIISVERVPNGLLPGVVKNGIVFGGVAVVLTYLLCAVRMLLKASEKQDEDESTEEQ